MSDEDNPRIIRIDPATDEQMLLTQGGLLQNPTSLLVVRGPVPTKPCTLTQSTKVQSDRPTLSHEVGTTAPPN